MFAVVSIPEENCFDIVPTNWIEENTLYRPLLKGSLLENAVRNRDKVGKRRRCSTVRVIQRTATFSEAGNVLAELTATPNSSGVISPDDLEPPCKVSKTDEHVNTVHEESTTSPPGITIDSVSKAYKVEEPVRCNELSTVCGTPDSICSTSRSGETDTIHTDTQVNAVHTAQATLLSVNMTNSTEDCQLGKSALADGVTMILNAFRRCEKKWQLVEKQLQQLEVSNALLIRRVERAWRTVSNVKREPVCLGNLLPLQTEAEWNQFEKSLLSRDFQSELIDLIRSIKGTTPRETIRLILQCLISSSLAYRITWHGSHTKIAFENSRLFRAIRDALWKFDDFDGIFYPAQLDKACTRWLQDTRECFRKKLLRMRKTKLEDTGPSNPS
ncbi:unnamed protein product [Calicophoron daubneyi]|uniref:DUF4806 domain-containing protein n=1 Tax=Calicophoron daubneyi TaxID=300641 RepID=A0AAV2TQL9_CALDB